MSLYSNEKTDNLKINILLLYAVNGIFSSFCTWKRIWEYLRKAIIISLRFLMKNISYFPLTDIVQLFAFQDLWSCEKRQEIYHHCRLFALWGVF